MSPPDSDGTRPERVLFVSGSGASATLRYRVRLPEEALRGRGVRTAAVHFTDRRARALAARADVVVLYRVPAGAEAVALVEEVRRRPDPPLVTYDVDDLVFRPEHLAGMPFLADFPADLRATFERDVELRGRMVPYADLVTGSTQEILDELALLTDAPRALLPNGVGRVGLRIADAGLGERRPHGDGLRIGYFSGSATHDEDWMVAEPAVATLLDERPDAELWLVGQVRASAALERYGSRVRSLKPVDWTELPALLAAVDLTVAPLARNPFTDAKSAIKWLEAALVETPTIATPTPPFRVAVDDGATGLFAEDDDGWAEALRSMADPGLRERLGRKAREAALASYGPRVQADRVLAALSNRPRPGTRVVASTPRDLPHVTRWAPVLLAAYPWPVDVASRTFGPDARHRPGSAMTVTAGRASMVRARAVRKARRTAYAVVSRVLRRPRPAPGSPPRS